MFMNCLRFFHDFFMSSSPLHHDVSLPLHDLFTTGSLLSTCLAYDLLKLLITFYGIILNYSWIVHDLFMTCSWLARCSCFDHYLIISTCTQFVHELFMNCLWLVYSLVIRLVHLDTTCLWLIDHLFVHNLFKTCSRLVNDFITNFHAFSQLFHNNFVTCSGNVLFNSQVTLSFQGLL